MQVKCPQCKKDREVGKSMFRLIERGIHAGNCKSCAMNGNTHRYTEVFDKELYQTRLYKIWSNMKSRCTNKNTTGYENYGGRGIGYCKEWETFAKFIDSLPEGYSDKLTLDRIDNNKGYSKANCQWSNSKTQSNNRRSNRFITLGGVTKTLQQWIDKFGLKTSTVRMRLHYGWSEERALLTNKL